MALPLLHRSRATRRAEGDATSPPPATGTTSTRTASTSRTATSTASTSTTSGDTASDGTTAEAASGSSRSEGARQAQAAERDEEVAPGIGARVPVVHKYGAVLVALVVLAFGLLGFAGGLPYFSTSGQRIIGLSSNGLLSTISVVTAVVLVAAVLRGPRLASTVMMVVGVLFLVSALANLAVLDTGLNLLAFRFSNVVFSVIAGLVLLLLGAYGRVGGHLPPDSPYAHGPGGDGWDGGPAAELPSTPEEHAAERAIRAAERAVVQHVATADQRRRVAAMAPERTQAERRRVWMSFDGTWGRPSTSR